MPTQRVYSLPSIERRLIAQNMKVVFIIQLLDPFKKNRFKRSHRKQMCWYPSVSDVPWYY
jgi:hypothetical protein